MKYIKIISSDDDCNWYNDKIGEKYRYMCTRRYYVTNTQYYIVDFEGYEAGVSLEDGELIEMKEETK